MKLEGVAITIVRTARRKTVSIFIERDGTVKALAPVSASEEKIEETIRSKQFQIFTKLAKWKELNQGKVIREFVNGQSFLYLGRNYRLSIQDHQKVALRISGNSLILDKRKLPQAAKVFKHFYKEKTREKIEERLKVIQEKFRVKPNSLKVMELKNRWASCNRQNGLNFHWKCVMAPVSALDYIITHEMVHLTYPNHSPEFWNELDKKMPDFRKHEEWLKRNGVKMGL
ncbi:MAG: M48 family metallopeptidase [Bacteroidales bacterium]|nr:M48 family metallopeptidase [Bacteroidales bacterium]